jgi:hypothetical protein
MWEAEHGKPGDLSVFASGILPLLDGVPMSQLEHATGLSRRYLTVVRRGEKTPHPRHWQALLTAAGRPAPKPG